MNKFISSFYVTISVWVLAVLLGIGGVTLYFFATDPWIVQYVLYGFLFGFVVGLPALALLYFLVIFCHKKVAKITTKIMFYFGGLAVISLCYCLFALIVYRYTSPFNLLTYFIILFGSSALASVFLYRRIYYHFDVTSADELSFEIGSKITKESEK